MGYGILFCAFWGRQRIIRTGEHWMHI